MTDSNAAAGIDTINDFNQGNDRVDLAAIDAIPSTLPDDLFGWIRNVAFSNTAGELRYQLGVSDTRIEGDLDGDGVADLVIIANGLINFVAADFVL